MKTIGRNFFIIFRSGFFLVPFICLLIPVVILFLYQADIEVPFYYFTNSQRFPWLDFDVNLYLMHAKNITEGHWVNFVPRLAAPDGMNSAEYPYVFGELLVYGIMKIIGLFTKNFGIVANVFYILTFPLTGVSFYYLCHKLKMEKIIAVLGSTLFAFLPFHFHVSEMHLSLSFYVVVPFVVLLVLKMFHPENFVHEKKSERMLFAAITIILLSSSAIYFNLIGMIVIVLASAIYLFSTSQTAFSARWQHIVRNPLKIIIVSFFLIILYHLPAILLKFSASHTSFHLERGWPQTEFWGLKIIQLFLPIRGHFVPFLNEMSAAYNTVFPNAHVNEAVALGLFGALGLIILLARILGNKTAHDYISTLSKINILTILYATVGGFATLFSLLITPTIRSLYRVGPYIAAFSFLAIMLTLHEIKKKIPPIHKNKFNAIILLLFPLLLLDQSGTLALPEFARNTAAYYRDRDYFSAIEREVGYEGNVLQLPYAPYPEGGSIERAAMYEQFVPMLHTDRIGWSYASHKAKFKDSIYGKISNLTVENAVKELCGYGFNGILIDTHGYESDEEYREFSEFFSSNNNHPIVSADNRYLFFRICD